MNITEEQLKEMLSSLGYYLRCIGCDIDIREGVMGEDDRCSHDSMISHLAEKINKGDSNEQT